MPDGLDTPEQRAADAGVAVIRGRSHDEQHAAAQAVMGALPNDLKQAMAPAIMEGLNPDQQQAAAKAVMGELPQEQREQVADSVLGIPDRKTRQRLWYLVVVTLAAAVFVFGTMAFVLMYQKKTADAPLALATTALGGIVGLVATSPGSRS